MDVRRLGTFAGVRGTAAARARRRLRPVDDGRVPIVPTRTTRGEVFAAVAVVPSALGDVEAVAVAVLQGSWLSERLWRITFSAECERLRGGESLGSEAMAVEDAGSAKAEEQDRLKALVARFANLEKARGGKPDVAIDLVPRQKRLRPGPPESGDRGEKVVMKLEGLQKEEMDLTQLLLLKQQEISDTKSEAAEKAQEVDTLQARPLAEVDCDGSASHVSSSASCFAPLSPQQWALGLAASLPEDVRVKFEEWYNSVEIEAKASVDPYSEVLSHGSPATSL